MWLKMFLNLNTINLATWVLKMIPQKLTCYTHKTFNNREMGNIIYSANKMYISFLCKKIYINTYARVLLSSSCYIMKIIQPSYQNCQYHGQVCTQTTCLWSVYDQIITLPNCVKFLRAKKKIHKILNKCNLCKYLEYVTFGIG